MSSMFLLTVVSDFTASSLRQLKERGLKGLKLITSDRCLGLVESIADLYPDALWQRCVVHFYRNVFSLVPAGRVREVAAMLKAIHAQKAKAEALAKIEHIATKLDAMKLGKAAELVRSGAPETISYYAFPEQHWQRIRTNNSMERIMCEIRRRKAIGRVCSRGLRVSILTAPLHQRANSVLEDLVVGWPGCFAS